MKKLYMFYLTLYKSELITGKYPGAVGEQEFYKETKDGKVHLLYAYTNEKELAEEFKSIRDMRKFVYDETSISKDKMEEFISENELTILDHHLIKTRAVNSKGDYEASSISVLMTTQESNLLYDYYYVRDRLEYIAISPLFNFDNHKMSIFETLKDFLGIFKKEYSKALIILEFYHIIGSFHSDEFNDDFFEEDLLGVFLSMFANTFRKG